MHHRTMGTCYVLGYDFCIDTPRDRHPHIDGTPSTFFACSRGCGALASVALHEPVEAVRRRLARAARVHLSCHDLRPPRLPGALARRSDAACALEPHDRTSGRVYARTRTIPAAARRLPGRRPCGSARRPEPSGGPRSVGLRQRPSTREPLSSALAAAPPTWSPDHLPFAYRAPSTELGPALLPTWGP